MKLKTIFIPLFVFFASGSFSQTIDTLLVTVSKDEKLEGGIGVYTVTMKNVSKTPVCILYSISINLFYDPPQRLSVFMDKDTFELYSLEYAARDTLYEIEGLPNNFDGEIILPLQEIKFRLSLLDSGLKKKLKFEYAKIENFCYQEFENEISKDVTQWYRKYKRIPRIIELP